MSTRKREPSDERNSSFGSAAAVAEHKPGMESVAARAAEVEEGHHRRSPSDAKKIPQESLAKRIGKPRKGE